MMSILLEGLLQNHLLIGGVAILVLLMLNIRTRQYLTKERAAHLVELAERKRAEAALRESEVRFRTAIESIPFDVFIIDTTHRYVLQNSTCRKNWGDVIGKHPEEVTDDAQQLALWASNNRRAFAGEIIEGEVLQTVGGENIPMSYQKGREVTESLGVEHMPDRFLGKNTAGLFARGSDNKREIVLSNKIETQKIDADKGFLVGYSVHFKTPVFITFSAKNGIQVWYKHEGNCEKCKKLQTCRDTLLAEAKVRNFLLLDDTSKILPSKLAEALFTKIAGEEDEHAKKD